MRIFKLLCFIFIFSTSVSQEVQDSLDISEDTVSTEMIGLYTSYFKIVDGKLEGIGSEILQDEIANSQFVLLGETHDDIQTSLLTSSIIPILAEEGYQYFVIEQGRSALDLLFQVLSEPIDMSSELRRIHQEAVDKIEEPYFPFMDGVEDAQFMQAAIDNSMQIQGIDQEFFYSFPFLFNQLKVIAETKQLDQSSEFETLLDSTYLIAFDFLMDQYKMENRQKDYPFFTNLLASESIKNYFKLTANNPQNQKIIEDILLSWKIYEQNRLNRTQSFQMRGDLMKQRFNELYQLAASSSRKPKMLIKLGGMHTMRGKTPLGISDIGQTVENLTKKNGSQDLNIYFMFRYYLDDEEELGYFDNSVGNSQWLLERRPILLQGKPDEWALIDLKSLKSSMEEEGYVYLYPAIQQLIDRHDYILIPPATDDVRPNYEPK